MSETNMTREELIVTTDESRKNTMNWIRSHMDKLNPNNESDCIDDIVNDEDVVYGAIGISKEMIEGGCR